MAKPSASYKNSARLAVAGLLLFVMLYCALAGWFVYTAWRVFVGGAGAGADLGFVAYLMAACSLFISVVMIKAIFSVKNAKPDDLLEVTPEEQPRLFAFLFELADAAGAPRPHKVFLSARVNAAVFYDLSLFNLFFPSKKNLEIGLALVNTISLGEFRAVLAHEFGHFAQRSMAVGRWVYVAQQIATHMVTRRDKLDEFLVGLGNIDLRIRLFVGVVQLIIWSIRSLVESLFNVVILMQRALSREMEMQADLVAVSLTGSDALVHALHRMQGADDAWDRALHFVFGENGSGRATRDVFAVQTHMVQRMSAILNDAAYAKVPPLPAQGADRHRVFKAELAQPPKMWLTHPLNHEREANAKRVYVAAPIDPASAWSVFEKPAALREQMTARVLGESEAAAVELEESLRTLAKQFKREQYNRRYCGVYFGRPLARHVDNYTALRDPAYRPSAADLATMYPDSLAADVQQLRTLHSELGQLRALIAGVMTAPGKTVRLRGVEFRKSQLPAAQKRVLAEIEETEARLHAHDKLCRSWHQNTARLLGGDWQAYLDGLLALVHYTEHTAANIEDLQGMLNNAAAVVTAVRRVTADGVSRVVGQANELHYNMEQVHKEAPRVIIDTRLAQRLELSGTWKDMLGDFTLPLAQNDNINEWMRVIDGWVASMVNSLNALRGAALEELLLTETQVARMARQPEAVESAPTPSAAPVSHAVLLAGRERERQTRLDWWARFQRADGVVAGGARVLVAGGIVAAVLGAGSFSKGHGTSVFGSDPALMVYNGLALPVVVTIDGKRVDVPPLSARPLVLPEFGHHRVEAKSADGRVIETFEADAKPGGHPVYSVAGAVPLVEWTNPYGNVEPKPERVLGAQRWLESSADHVFSEPPKQITSKGKGGYRTVLDGMGKFSPEMQINTLADDKERHRVALLHARWDPTSAAGTEAWLAYTSQFDPDVIAQRLAAAPRDVYLRRIEFDLADAPRKQALCTQAAADAAAAPDDGDLTYLSLRCQHDSPATAAKMREASERWPDNAWMLNSITWDQMRSKDWLAALPQLEKLRRKLPARADGAIMDIARIRHYEQPNADLQSLAADSPRLRELITLDKGDGKPDSPARAYATLAHGQLGLSLGYAMGDDWHEAHVLRLVAASDGASADSAKRVMALPLTKGLDAATAWLGLALAMKNGYDAKPFEELVAKGLPDHDKVSAFLNQIKAGKDPRACEALLKGVHPETRAHAYSAALVLAGRKAPAEWRDTVRRVLFASERPYFS